VSYFFCRPEPFLKGVILRVHLSAGTKRERRENIVIPSLALNIALICYTTGRDWHQPTNPLKNVYDLQEFYLPHNPCMIFFSSELTMHDFFLPWAAAGNVFSKSSSPPPFKSQMVRP